MHCRHCPSENIIKHGETTAGKRRFRCKECGKTFVESREIYTPTEKRLLSMFVEFLDARRNDEFDLKDFLKRSKERYRNGSGKIIIKDASESTRFDITKAKMIICQDGDKISLFKVKSDVIREIERNRLGVPLRAVGIWTEHKQERQIRRQELKRMTPEEKMLAKKKKKSKLGHRKPKSKSKLPEFFPNINEYQKPSNDNVSD